MTDLPPPYDLDDASEREAARQRLATPAVLMGLLGALGILGSIVSLITTLVRGGTYDTEFLRPFIDDEDQLRRIAQMSSGPLAAAGSVLAIVAGVVIVVGAWKMYRVQTYALAVAAAVLSIIPCTSPCCCCFGMPVGIWALVVLLDPKVQASFR